MIAQAVRTLLALTSVGVGVFIAVTSYEGLAKAPLKDISIER